MNAPNACQPWIPEPRETLIALSLAVGLTLCFWWPLWLGGGPQGGDLYSYYMPQKALLAASLQHGELPLWNDRTGFGYPAAAESQTGVLYPPNWILYSAFDLNTAYVVSQLGHYVVAFLATWGLIRQLGLGKSAAAIGALAFVYGWLPPRICLEWAVVGAAYFAVILWTGIAWLETGCPRSLGALSIALGLDILAGHFNLAFIAVLALGTLSLLNAVRSGWVLTLAQETPMRRGRSIWMLAAIWGGFLIAEVQVLPTWELKQASQRKDVGAAFDPAYGHLPPVYLTQLVAPWLWHGPEISTDKALEQPSPGRYPAATNKVEAHLYVGLLPLLLALGAVGLSLQGTLLQRPLRIPVLPWVILGVVGIVLATGWPLVVLKHLPGFSFFMGPGRYGMLTAMSLAVLAAAGWETLSPQWFKPQHLLGVLVGLFLFTVADLWAVSREYSFGEGLYFGRQVFYTTLLDDVPIDFLAESKTVEHHLSAQPGTRLYAPGANIPSLLGVPSLPVYLGLGPQIYFEPEQQLDFSTQSLTEINTISDRLRGWGVTHLLLQTPLVSPDWPVGRAVRIVDPVLNRALGRAEPFYLYTLQDARGRAYLNTTGNIDSLVSSPNSVTVMYTSSTPAELTLTDLDYPGWEVTIDGAPASNKAGETFRIVAVPAGSHTVRWSFRPLSVRIGGVISCLSLIGIVGSAWYAFRRKQACQLVLPKQR